MLRDYFDVQVNGYGGIDYNSDNLTADALHRSCEALERDGNTGILATVITDKIERMCHRLANIVRHREHDPLAKRMIQGIHIEGPFINPQPGYRGAHPEDSIHPTNAEEMKQLLEAAGGLTRLVTIAPEVDPGMRVTRSLVNQGITVSAGHSNATIDELRQAIDAGVTMYTHLGNGCPMQMHRHDNIIQRVLSLPQMRWISFICDGAHIPLFALGNYIRLAGVERTVITTDAMAMAGQGPGRYTIGRWTVDVGDDLVPWAPDKSHLLGSGVTMPRSYDNLLKAGVSAGDLKRIMCENPRRCCGLDRAVAAGRM
jgi:N-acetylglucosamine-6-phosphate deacetylase